VGFKGSVKVPRFSGK